MGRARNNVKNTIAQVQGLVRAKVMQAPVWLSAVEKFPTPLRPQPDWIKVPKIALPQDRLVRIYKRRLKSLATDDDTCFEFASEQLQLIEQGVDEYEAFQQIKDKYLKLNRDRVLANIAEASGKKYIALENQKDIFQSWADDESAAIKEAMDIEFEQKKAMNDVMESS